MNLLPKSKSDFREKSYWDSFFKKRGNKAFEWYGEYGELCGILHKYIKTKDSILMVGCGNSTLGADLFDVGYNKLVNIDISNKVVDQMKRQRPDMNFAVQDVTDMSGFAEDQEYTVALDKGTLDAMFTGAEDASMVDKMFSEINRVLKFGGRYIVITLLQPHILEHVSKYFTDRGWPLRIVRCKEADLGKSPADRRFPVFVLIATKFKPMANMKPVLEFGLSSESVPTRLSSSEELVSSVKGIQQFAAVRAGIAKGTFNADARNNSDVSLDLVDADGRVRYSMFLAEQSESHITANRAFAVFIVPQGRETEWLFGSVDGRSQLCKSSGSRRLVVVHLQRNQVYESLDQVKSELSANVMELAPPDLSSNSDVPIMSVGEDNSVGNRLERCHGNSETSGQYVVEDVSVNGEWFRRLIFLHNAGIVQSEAKLKLVKGGKKRVLDLNYLCQQYHTFMIGAMGAKPKANVLVVGLGGGVLPSYIVAKFPKVSVDCVEVDPLVARLAKDQFGLQESARLSVKVIEGAEFVKQQADKKYDVVIVDVDNKDSSIRMARPSRPFTKTDFIRSVKTNCLTDKGIFVLHFSCWDSDLRNKAVCTLREEFSSVLNYPLSSDDEGVTFCSSKSKEELLAEFKAVNTEAKDDLIDLEDAMKNLCSL